MKRWMAIVSGLLFLSGSIYGEIIVWGSSMGGSSGGVPAANLTVMGNADWKLMKISGNAWVIDQAKNVPTSLLGVDSQSTSGSFQSGTDDNSFSWTDGTPTVAGTDVAPASRLRLTGGTDINTKVVIAISTGTVGAEHTFTAWLGSKRANLKMSWSTDKSTWTNAQTYTGINNSTLFEHQFSIHYTPSAESDTMYILFEWNIVSGVTSDELAHFDAMALILSSLNVPPVVNAGLDGKIVLPANQIALDGTVTDSDPFTVQWSVAEGDPNRVVFALPNDVDTTATFQESGDYLLRLTATDSSNVTASDTVAVKVRPAGFDGLEAHLTFENSDPNLAVKSITGIQYVGTIQGDPNVGFTASKAKLGSGALELVGNDYLTYSKYLGSDPALTAALWFNCRDLAIGGRLIEKWANDFSNVGWFIRIREGAGNLAAMIGSRYNGPGVYLQGPAGGFVADEWVHVALTFQDGVMSLYQNGIRVDREINVIFSPADLVTPVNIGRRQNPNSEYFNGLIDEIRIYDRALSDAEIHSLYTEDGGQPWNTCLDPQLAGDLDRDCQVNLGDMATLSGGWQNSYTLATLLDVAETWLQCDDFDPSRCP